MTIDSVVGFLFFSLLNKIISNCSVGWGREGAGRERKVKETNTYAGNFLNGVNEGPMGWVSFASQSSGYALSLPVRIQLVHPTSPMVPKNGGRKGETTESDKLKMNYPSVSLYNISLDELQINS